MRTEEATRVVSWTTPHGALASSLGLGIRLRPPLLRLLLRLGLRIHFASRARRRRNNLAASLVLIFGPQVNHRLNHRKCSLRRLRNNSNFFAPCATTHNNHCQKNWANNATTITNLWCDPPLQIHLSFRKPNRGCCRSLRGQKRVLLIQSPSTPTTLSSLASS